MARSASLVALPLIAGLIALLYLASIGLSVILGIPWDLLLPWPVRILGAGLAGLGAAVIGSVLRLRGFGAAVESTYATLMKLLRRAPLSAPVGRTEPLVVAGPYRYARHPLYSGVIALAFGIGLAVDHPWALLAAGGLYLWFALVLAPFEEVELRALFGEDYAAYMETHRRFLPVRRRPR